MSPHEDTPRNEDGSLSFLTTYRRNRTVGRDVAVNSLCSLQGCPKKYRGPLAAEYFHDLDMENCHYLIMLQVAEAHGVSLSCVRYYVDSRDECLQRVQAFYGVTRKAAKDLFLSVLNGGAPWAWMHKFSVDRSLRDRLTRGDLEHPSIIQQLQAEYATIRSVMFDHYRDKLITSMRLSVRTLKTRAFARWQWRSGGGYFRDCSSEWH